MAVSIFVIMINVSIKFNYKDLLTLLKFYVAEFLRTPFLQNTSGRLLPRVVIKSQLLYRYISVVDVTDVSKQNEDISTCVSGKSCKTSADI